MSKLHATTHVITVTPPNEWHRYEDETACAIPWFSCRQHYIARQQLDVTKVLCANEKTQKTWTINKLIQYFSSAFLLTWKVMADYLSTFAVPFYLYGWPGLFPRRLDSLPIAAAWGLPVRVHFPA